MDRTDIYYWKCDRVSAFHGTSDFLKDQGDLLAALERTLKRRFGADIAEVAPGGGQGNHRTFTARLRGERVFIRTEDGPESDGYFAVEKAVTDRVAALGVPVPKTLAYDVSRTETGFSWQIIPYVDASDLNALFKAGELDWSAVAPAIGRAIAMWQGVTASGFGPFSASRADRTGELVALHPSAESYYRLNLRRHVDYLVRNDFLAEEDARRIFAAVEAHIAALDRPGVLVHKDTALWNMLGTATEVRSFIDWDDAIVGDAMDDLSLMACFHGRDVLRTIVAGYEEVRPLPPDAAPRFWLDLLRNMLFKAVIRVGAGYFRRDARFFLVAGGESLEAVTRRKIGAALEGLEQEREFL